jgi:adenosylcobinamide kinase/adenosylcobinamide-phosphate guanylyltransferase
MGKLTFITGGARSGKSSFAIEEASALGGKKVFVATLEPHDEEMKKRMELHRGERGEEWTTHEEPLELAGLLRRLNTEYDVVLVDCLTLWLSNAMHANKDVEKEIAELVEGLSEAKESINLYVVSNEVGMGIVPENEMARQFRDNAGRLNQKVAGAADEVFLMASGIPVRIKGEGE